MASLNLLARYGMHATYYIPSGLVCFPSKTMNCATSQYLTLPDARKIAAAGHEIGGLTVSHVSLDTSMPTAEAQREICADRVNLLRWGFPVTDFAYPFTVAQPRIESLVSRARGWRAGAARWRPAATPGTARKANCRSSTGCSPTPRAARSRSGSFRGTPATPPRSLPSRTWCGRSSACRKW